MTESRWSRLVPPPHEGPFKYARPLLGSELFADQVMLSQDGFGECCMGITFTTLLPIEDLQDRLIKSLACFRFYAPIIAASLQAGIHDADLRSWVYEPVKCQEELQRWVSETLTIVQDPVDASQFIQRMNSKKLPYILTDGRSQYLRVYLMRPSGTRNEFGLFFHGTHALMDARPSINAFNLLLEYMSSPDPLDASSLPWGTEWIHLPDGPIASTGGPRSEVEWGNEGNALFAKITNLYENPMPPHSLHCNSTSVSALGHPRRFLIELTASETKALLTALKTHGYTFTHLIEAAIALATFKLNPVPPENAAEAHVTYGSSVISLSRNLIPAAHSKGHFISRFALVPVRVRLQDVAECSDERGRLLAGMQSLKQQYAEYLSNPCTPHLMAEQMRLAPPRNGLPMVNPYAATVTNLGNVENILPVLWPHCAGAHGRPRFRVSALHFGHRVTLPTPMFHIWTMHSRLMIQMQATDSWEEKVLQEYMDEILNQVLLLSS